MKQQLRILALMITSLMGGYAAIGHVWAGIGTLASAKGANVAGGAGLSALGIIDGASWGYAAAASGATLGGGLAVGVAVGL
jgi:hypothetical protein